MVHANLTLGPSAALLVIIALDVSKLIADNFCSQRLHLLAFELDLPTCALASTRRLRPNPK